MGFLGLVVAPNAYYFYSGKIYTARFYVLRFWNLVPASQPAELGQLIRTQAQLDQPPLPELASMLATEENQKGNTDRNQKLLLQIN